MYLLDTNIVVFSFRGNNNVNKKIEKIGFGNCYISAITIAELKYGATKSNHSEYHNSLIKEFLKKVKVIPIEDVLDVFASEKVRLEKTGNRIDDFDLLIGATAISSKLILVTNNTKHLQRMKLKNIEDWTI